MGERQCVSGIRAPEFRKDIFELIREAIVLLVVVLDITKVNYAYS